MICPHCGKAFPRREGKIEKVKSEEVLILHRRGYSLREIQELTGISFATAGRIVRAAKNKSDASKKKDDA
jgi:transposase